MNSLKLKYLTIIGVSLLCLIMVVKAEENKCATCSTILTADQNTQLMTCIQNCEQQHIVQNVFSNYKRTQFFVCAENCQNTDPIKSKRVCEIENCQTFNSTAAIPLQKCQFQKCNQLFIDFQIYVGEQSEILSSSKCKDISYSTTDEISTIATDCTNDFYSKAESQLNLATNPKYTAYKDCIQTNCSSARL